MKPSILFITTDEQHIETISAFGAKTHSTPNIDSLINQSNVYIQAYSASPECLPARCSWMTGLYPHHNNCISNTFGASLPRERPNLMTELKKQGYKTSLHGKAHFIPVPYAATRQDLTLEYEHFIAYYESLGIDTLNLQDGKNCSTWFYDHYAKEMEVLGVLKDYRVESKINKAKHQGVFDFPGDSKYHPDAWVGRKTAEYIASCGESPEFIWASFSGPHYPIDTPAEYIKKVDMSLDSGRIFQDGEWDDPTKLHVNSYHGPGATEGSACVESGAQKNYTEEYWTRWRQVYFGNVVLIDEMIGEIISAARAKWGENLLIVFTADHGDLMGNHSLWGKNGSLHEDVLRVPLTVCSPGQTQRQDFPQMVSSLDIFPTILEAADAPVPPCDAMTLESQCRAGGRPYVLSMCDGRVAIVKDGIKLEHNLYTRNETMYKELYDLTADPHEFVNQYSNPQYAKHIQELENMLEQEEGLLHKIFFNGDVDPYWLNKGGNY